MLPQNIRFVQICYELEILLTLPRVGMDVALKILDIKGTFSQDSYQRTRSGDAMTEYEGGKGSSCFQRYPSKEDCLIRNRVLNG